MTISYSDDVRNDMLQSFADSVDSAAAGGRVHIYDGARPATGGGTTNRLARPIFDTTAFNAPVAGVMTAQPMTDIAAELAGTATWFRIADGFGQFLLDGDVGLAGSGADLILDDVVISLAENVSITSLTITQGNP